MGGGIPRYSQTYVADEVRAKTAHAGIWSSSFAMPEEWRAVHDELVQPRPQYSSPQRPFPQSRANTYADGNGCLIKGNRNRKGQWIYHLPGMPYYNVTRPEERFCTEAQAQAAGYRRAIVWQKPLSYMERNVNLEDLSIRKGTSSCSSSMPRPSWHSPDF